MLGFLGYIKTLCDKRKNPVDTPKPRKFQTMMPPKQQSRSKPDPESPISKRLDNQLTFAQYRESLEKFLFTQDEIETLTILIIDEKPCAELHAALNDARKAYKGLRNVKSFK